MITDQGDAIGLISTATVDAGRVRDIAQKVAELDRQGAKRFILDLRQSCQRLAGGWRGSGESVHGQGPHRL